MSLRAAIDANPAGWFDVLRRQPGAEVDEQARAILTEVPFPLCNSVVFPAWSADEADERIDAVLAAGVARLWWLGTACSPPDLIERLERRGVVVDAETLPGMAMELAALDAVARPDGLRVERVTGRAALDAFGVPFAAGFELPADALASVLAAFEAHGLHRDDLQHHVGFADGEPVACASVLVADGVAGLYDVATVPAARGRGYGAALSSAALIAAARDGGATGAILHASPSGARIYERLGFRALALVHTLVTAEADWGA